VKVSRSPSFYFYLLVITLGPWTASTPVRAAYKLSPVARFAFETTNAGGTLRDTLDKHLNRRRLREKRPRELKRLAPTELDHDWSTVLDRLQAEPEIARLLDFSVERFEANWRNLVSRPTTKPVYAFDLLREATSSAIPTELEFREPELYAANQPASLAYSFAKLSQKLVAAEDLAKRSARPEHLERITELLTEIAELILDPRLVVAVEQDMTLRRRVLGDDPRFETTESELQAAAQRLLTLIDHYPRLSHDSAVMTRLRTAAQPGWFRSKFAHHLYALRTGETLSEDTLGKMRAATLSQPDESYFFDHYYRLDGGPRALQARHSSARDAINEATGQIRAALSISSTDPRRFELLGRAYARIVDAERALRSAQPDAELDQYLRDRIGVAAYSVGTRSYSLQSDLSLQALATLREWRLTAASTPGLYSQAAIAVETVRLGYRLDTLAGVPHEVKDDLREGTETFRDKSEPTPVPNPAPVPEQK
jgi:hypothetical protein